MSHIEIRISRDNFERIIFISIILVLLIVSVISFTKQEIICPETACEEVKAVKPVVEKVIGKVVEKPVEKVVESVKPVEEKTVEVPLPSKYYVDIENFHFAPKELIVKKGSVIVFRNNEPSLVHKLYEIRGLFFGPRIEPLDKWNYSFNETGNYTVVSIMGKSKGTKMDIFVI